MQTNNLTSLRASAMECGWAYLVGLYFEKGPLHWRAEVYFSWRITGL